MKIKSYIVSFFLILANVLTFSQTTLLAEDFNYTAGDAITNHGWVETPAVNIESKLLFVGNSFTFYNDGVDYHVQKLIQYDTSFEGVSFDIQKIAVSSYTLEGHYNDPLTMAKIRSNNWNIVVLQEQSTRPINSPDLFLQYATLLDTEIKKMNARTVLYMTWAPKATLTDIDQLAASYISVGQKLNVQVVPVGKVWDSFVSKYPSINIYYTDNKHPSLAGTFLIACTFYYSLYGRNPVLNTYVPVGLSSANAVSIRKAVYDYMQLNK
jgi:hypothetical protein